MSMFKKYMVESEGREAINLLNLYLDVEVFNSISQGERGGKQKKDVQAQFISK